MIAAHAAARATQWGMLHVPARRRSCSPPLRRQPRRRRDKRVSMNAQNKRHGSGLRRRAFAGKTRPHVGYRAPEEDMQNVVHGDAPCTRARV